MKTALTYEHSFDQEVHRQAEVNLGSLDIQVIAGTVAGSPQKPNEDAFALTYNEDTLVSGVFDGTTSLKPIPALNGQTGARFASHFLRECFDRVDETATPENLMIDFNTDLLEASRKLGGALEDTHTLPATLATIVKLDVKDESLTFAHAGDAFGIAYYNDGSSKVFTDDKNAKFDNSIFSLMSDVANAEHISHRQARDDERVKSALIEMFIRRNNNPDGTGSGLVNGDPNLAAYIQTGKLMLKDMSAVLIASDGLLPPGWSLQSEDDRQRMRSAIENGGMKHMFDIKHDAEDSDPDWQHVRFKHSDDATGLLMILA